MASTYDKGHFLEVLEALHRDQTGLAAAMNRIIQIANGYSWLAEGSRACYEYDDEEYFKEIGYCLDKIIQEAEQALKDSGDKAHQVCCVKYGDTHRLPIVPTQRRLRFAQTYNEYADEMIDYCLLEPEEKPCQPK